MQLFIDNFDSQTIQFTFEEVIKAIDVNIVSFYHLSSTNAQMTSTHFIMNVKDQENQKQRRQKSYSKAHDILNSALHEWKNIEWNEQNIDVIAFCDKD